MIEVNWKIYLFVYIIIGVVFCLFCVCDYEWGKKWIFNMELVKVYLYFCEGVIILFKLFFLFLFEWFDFGNDKNIGIKVNWVIRI